MLGKKTVSCGELLCLGDLNRCVHDVSIPLDGGLLVLILLNQIVNCLGGLINFFLDLPEVF
jgi:hypothetical protein